MMGVDHPGLGFSLQDLVRMVRREALAALQNSSIGRAGLRFYDGGKALFQGGGGVEIQDTGYIIIDGDLTGDGDFNWTGPMVFTGTVNATGNTAWSGIMSIVGELRVLPGGKIQVGNMIIDPANGGSVQYPGGAVVKGGVGGGVVVQSGAYAAVVTNTGASLGKNGYGFSVTDSAGFRADGLPVGNPGTQYPAGVIYKNTNGQLREASGA